MFKAALALFFVPLALAAADSPWKLVWSDEFDVEGAPSPQRWTNEVGFIRNREVQYYTRENARVENGLLVIEARKDESSRVTSASLTTEGLFQCTYGRIEVRAKLPQGRGVWPAIWMLGASIHQVGWPRCGEIDIMEFVGYEPTFVHANVHSGKYNHMKQNGRGSKLPISAENVSETFHSYALEWTPDRLDFFFDSQKYFSCNREPDASTDAWPFDQPFFLILNLAIGGDWGGREGVDNAIFPQRFEIDFVRVFQRSSP